VEHDLPPPPAALVDRGARRLFRPVRPHGQQLAYVYFEDEPGRRPAAKLLSGTKRGSATAHSVAIGKDWELLVEQIRECLQHAEDCARKAAAQSDPNLKEDFLTMERRWRFLARSYEFSERLDDFSDEAKRNVDKLPKAY